MTAPSDPGTAVLGAILPGRADLLDIALRKLRPEHFGGQVLPGLFTYLGTYLNMTGEVATRMALQWTLESQRVQAGTMQVYLEQYDLLSSAQVSDGEFSAAVDALRDAASERATGEALSEAYEVLTRGKDGEQGPEAARRTLMERFAEIDAGLQQAEAPEGDIRAEGNEILSRYTLALKRRQDSGGRPGIQTGIGRLDELLGGGLQAGELALIAGFSSSGKTSACVSIAWEAVTSGRNIVYLTSETLRPDVINKLVARHSRHPQYAQELPDGLDSMKIRGGSLSGPEVAQFAEVLRDLTGNKEYGSCYVAQLPFGATIGTVASRLARIGRMFRVDLCVIDYLQLLRADRRRDAAHEEASQMVKDAKAVAATFDGGRGIPVISPWQVNRTGRDRALKEGGYSGVDLANTSEAFNTPDIVVTLLEPARIENPRSTPVKCEVLKNRGGPRGSVFEVRVDYATSLFRSADDGYVASSFADSSSIESLMGG